jgi:hypothetical protein
MAKSTQVLEKLPQLQQSCGELAVKVAAKLW